MNLGTDLLVATICLINTGILVSLRQIRTEFKAADALRLVEMEAVLRSVEQRVTVVERFQSAVIDKEAFIRRWEREHPDGE